MPEKPFGVFWVVNDTAMLHSAFGGPAGFMTIQRILLSIAAVVVGALVTGCYSTQTTAYLGPRKIKVVDASTKHPIAGAQVALYCSKGQCMGQRTDNQGNMRVASGLLTAGLPKYDRIEVTSTGYESVAFQLTNGLPHQVEMIPRQN